MQPSNIEIRLAPATQTILYKGKVIAVMAFDDAEWQINVYPDGASEILGMSAPTIEAAIPEAILAYCRASWNRQG